MPRPHLYRQPNRRQTQPRPNANRPSRPPWPALRLQPKIHLDGNGMKGQTPHPKAKIGEGQTLVPEDKNGKRDLTPKPKWEKFWQLHETGKPRKRGKPPFTAEKWKMELSLNRVGRGT